MIEMYIKFQSIDLDWVDAMRGCDEEIVKETVEYFGLYQNVGPFPNVLVYCNMEMIPGNKPQRLASEKFWIDNNRIN